MVHSTQILVHCGSFSPFIPFRRLFDNKYRIQQNNCTKYKFNKNSLGNFHFMQKDMNSGKLIAAFVYTINIS